MDQKFKGYSRITPHQPARVNNVYSRHATLSSQHVDENKQTQLSVDLFGRTVAGHLQPLLLPVEEQHSDDEDDDDEQERCQYPRRRLVDVGHLRLAGVVLPRAGGVWRGERKREERVSIPAVSHFHDDIPHDPTHLFQLMLSGWPRPWISMSHAEKNKTTARGVCVTRDVTLFFMRDL